MNDGPGLSAWDLANERMAQRDEEARVTLCRQCGIDPDRVTPESPKQPLQLRKYRNPTRRADK